MISAGLEGRLSYMTYPSEPWGGPPKQPPEFLRPAPKPLSQTSKYNGVAISTAPNGARLIPSQRLSTAKYVPPTTATPVNLTSSSSSQQSLHKDETVEDLQYSAYTRLFPPPHSFAHYPTPYAIYQSPYTPLLRPNFVPPPPLSPLEAPPYTPTTPSASATTGATFLSPSSTFSPPILSQTSPKQHQQHASVVVTSTAEKRPILGFKVPSGKEGSLKHRILTRPGDVPRTITDIQKAPSTDTTPTSSYHQACISSHLPSVLSDVATFQNRNRLTATFSPPSSPAASTKTVLSNNIVTSNNNVLPANSFVKGALIQLANGELRRIEDMQTEDFVQSAEKSSQLRLADSTVVRIEEAPTAGTVTVTLTYNQRRTKVEFESNVEHPFFVYGRGWASFAPERTLQVFGLKVHRLQVGDVLISLTPREPSSSSNDDASSTTTTATTTIPTSRHIQHHKSNISAANSKNSLTTGQYSSRCNNYNNNNNNNNNNLLNLVISNANVQTKSGVHVNYQTNSYIANSNQRQVNSHSQPNQTIASDVMESEAAKKRRWSAPDEICDDNEQVSIKKVKLQ